MIVKKQNKVSIDWKTLKHNTEDFLGKDPIRYPKIQTHYEGEFASNYDKTLKTIITEIVKIIV